MGCDCKIYLPPNVEIDTVAEVMGKLSGCPARSFPLGDTGYTSTKVDNATVESTCSVQMARILIKGDPLVDGEPQHFCYYHFEGRGGNRQITGRSTGYWIALGRKLVDFFGGRVDYNDCDSEDSDYVVEPKSDDLNQPEDDEPWEDLQQRVLNLPPMTAAEIAECVPFSAYNY